MSEQITLDTRELDRIAAKLGVTRDRIVMSLAFDIEAQAKQNAPVDTGALENSIYVEGKDKSGYQQAAAAVTSRRPKVHTGQHPIPSGKVIANVGPCVDYAEYVELGVYAQPFLLPAAYSVANKMNAGATWKELCE